MFTKIKICMLFLCCICILPGCAILGDPAEKAAKASGRLVKIYCENITVPEIREKIRERVNYHAAPHSIRVECINGGPVLTTEKAPKPEETVAP